MAKVCLRPIFCVFLLLVVLIALISHHGTDAQPNFLKSFCGNDTTNSNSTYQTNLQALLLNISFNIQIDYGFYNFSSGENSGKVNVIALCRGDVSAQDCRSCISDSRVVLPQVCPNMKEAIGWHDFCFLRYSDRSIFDVMETSPSFSLWSTHDALQKDQFKNVLAQLMSSLRVTAATGDSMRKFAAANVSGPSNQTIFGLAQCTPDLSNDDCNVCLNWAINQIPKCCDGQTGGRVATPSCNVRYETYKFFGGGTSSPLLPAPPLPPPPHPPFGQPVSKQGKSNNTSRIVIAIVVPFVSIAVLISIVVIYLKFKVRRPQNIDTEAKDVADSLQMDFETIRESTNDFSDKNKLGQGGFGPVYLGRLYNGQEIAVKRLSREFGQGDMEFKNEVLLMAKLQHRNLVKLLGFSLKDKERLLVYEFVPNKSLDYFIFDPIKATALNWEKRYKIIEGIARGLLYLHQDSRIRIIHRDLKTSNILLDEEMNAKISDFGMARLLVMDQTQAKTNNIVGTYGYIAPEYAKHGRFSMKSDIFSLGVLILEIISGKRNSEYEDWEDLEHIGSAAWKSWRKGTLSSIIDPRLIEEGGSSRNEIMRCIQIGLLCVQEKASDRPTMDTIVAMLSAYSFSLPIPLQPSFYIQGGLPDDVFITSSSSSQEDQSAVEASRNELSISEQYPR
ncbi:putative receptor-like protein kinase At4g00960 [Neltuma alba]|uniref:putative receptor-like protein kinase At4g00960 n=1 Tax=Neltuma alba TaxID=207710 RepID=UPI0010A2BC0B|nr:putative receptor-like protein kinase At4g00960 [Prosopis alba]